MICQVELKDLYDLLLDIQGKVNGLVKAREIEAAIQENRVNTVEVAIEAVKQFPDLSFKEEGDEIVYTRTTPWGPQVWRVKKEPAK